MNPLLGLIIPALIPVVGDGLRGLFNWLTGGRGAEPANVQEAIELMNADVNKLRALAELDRPAGNISGWVADLRASFRYIAAALIILPCPFVIAYTAFYPSLELVDFVNLYLSQAVGPVFSFMFGSRLYLQLKGK